MERTTNGKNHLLKYVELPGKFYSMANDIEIAAKKQNRSCEAWAKQVAGMKAKNQSDQDRIDAMRDFLISTHDLNTKTLLMVSDVHQFLNDVIKDVAIIAEGSRLRNQLDDAIATIEDLLKQRETLITEMK